MSLPNRYLRVGKHTALILDEDTLADLRRHRWRRRWQRLLAPLRWLWRKLRGG